MKKIFFKEIRFILSMLLLSLFVIEPLAAAAGDVSSKKVLSNNQRVRQVLARLTFGTRGEDFERVKQIGVKAYIEQQLNPDSIDDSALDKPARKTADADAFHADACRTIQSAENVRNIITSPAFTSPVMYQTKIKSPFEFVAAPLKITGAETDANRPFLDWITKMSAPIFGHITPEGVPEKNDEWLSSGSLLTRFNFANALAENEIKGTTIDAKNFLGDADLDKPEAVAERLTNTLRQSEITARSKSALDKIAADAAVKLNEPKPEISAPDGKMSPPAQKPAAKKMPAYVAQLLTLTLGTLEFQRK